MAALAPVRLLLALAVLALARPAAAEDDTAALRAQLDALRAQVASQIQLLGFDLLDELVFGWTERPPFGAETPVVLAGVTAPVGMGTALAAVLENHFAALVVGNPGTRVLLAHCPACTSVIIHSGAEGTVVTRGVDDPDALAKVSARLSVQHAVFLDFEAEGAALVLRARITAIAPALPILWARTLSSQSSPAALLRSGDRIKSAEEAHAEYIAALTGHDVFLVPLRLGVRSYARSDSMQVSAPPYVWLQAGVETAFSQARAWTGSLSLGYSWAPELHNGLLAEARFARLLTGRVRSLTEPDLYVFLGGAVLSLVGDDTALFQAEPPPLDDILAQEREDKPRRTFGAWQVGLQLRVKNRISAAVFLESAPTINDSDYLGEYLDLGVVAFETIGAEVGFWF